MKQDLTTTGDVIDALGGTTAVSKIMGVALAVVSNWRSMERFPAHTFLGLRDALRDAGFAVPEDLWRMTQTARPEPLRVAE
jgi:hypothetical protein